MPASTANTNTRLAEIRSDAMAKGFAGAAPVFIDKGEGALLFDVEGNRYIDFAGGIAVMNVGHSHPKVVAAIQEQAARFTHTCFMVSPYESAVLLADRLRKAAYGPSEKSVFFTNSGAEAVENAVKIARYATGRTGIIALEGAFHGRTCLTMSLTSKVKPYKYKFGPFAPEIYRMPAPYCYRCPFNLTHPECDMACAEHLREMLIHHTAPETTAAIIIEPVIGEGGFIAPPLPYFERIKSICDEHGILLIADEIQTGIGRTGTMFAMEQYGVEADLTTTAKSLAAGMPLSAVVGKKELMDCVHPSGIGGTYGGNPVACAAALAVMDIMETEDLLERSKILGRTLHARLTDFQLKFPLIGDVRGLGPMIAMELVTDRKTKAPAKDETAKLVAFCREKNLIILPCGEYGNVIRLLMPLVITDAQLAEGMDILEQGLTAVSG